MNEKKIDEELNKIWNEVPLQHSENQKENSWEEFRFKTFPSQKKKFAWRNYAAAAALIILLIGTGFYFSQNKVTNEISITENVVENTTLKLKTVFLPDSSRIELSPNSKIQYASNFSINRKIDLTGEAYFKVKKDKKHPFQVFCKETTTTVLGTSFIVKEQAKKGVEVQLYEGSVQMNIKGQQQSWILKPGEKFTYGNENTAVAKFDRFIDFDNQKLTAVVAYVENNYGYKMILPEDYNNQLITIRINKKEDLKTIIQLISEMYNLNFEVNEKLKQITFQ